MKRPASPTHRERGSFCLIGPPGPTNRKWIRRSSGFPWRDADRPSMRRSSPRNRIRQFPRSREKGRDPVRGRARSPHDRRRMPAGAREVPVLAVPLGSPLRLVFAQDDIRALRMAFGTSDLWKSGYLGLCAFGLMGLSMKPLGGDLYGTRTRALAVKGRCPNR